MQPWGGAGDRGAVWIPREQGRGLQRWLRLTCLLPSAQPDSLCAQSRGTVSRAAVGLNPAILEPQLYLTSCVTLSTPLATWNLSVLACEMGTRPIWLGYCEEEGIPGTLSLVGTCSVAHLPRFSLPLSLQG